MIVHIRNKRKYAKLIEHQTRKGRTIIPGFSHYIQSVNLNVNGKITMLGSPPIYQAQVHFSLE